MTDQVPAPYPGCIGFVSARQPDSRFDRQCGPGRQVALATPAANAGSPNDTRIPPDRQSDSRYAIRRDMSEDSTSVSSKLGVWASRAATEYGPVEGSDASPMSMLCTPSSTHGRGLQATDLHLGREVLASPRSPRSVLRTRDVVGGGSSAADHRGHGIAIIKDPLITPAAKTSPAPSALSALTGSGSTITSVSPSRVALPSSPSYDHRPRATIAQQPEGGPARRPVRASASFQVRKEHIGHPPRSCRYPAPR